MNIGLHICTAKIISISSKSVERALELQQIEARGTSTHWGLSGHGRAAAAWFSGGQGGSLFGQSGLMSVTFNKCVAGY
jgi:hypothetical protein